MPMKRAMAQISRPYQIALLAVGAFVMVWFVALRNHSATPSSGGSAPAAVQPVQPSAIPTPTYHGSAPGVSGLTRAIRRAHEAVGVSQANARSLESSSALASGESSAPAQSTPVTQHSTHPSVTRPPVAVRTVPEHTAAAKSRAGELEGELKQGNTVILLFWNPQSVDDRAVYRQVQAAVHTLGSKTSVHYAHSSEVGTFGHLTEKVHVEQTPTILIINREQTASTITGLTDSFSIRQAVQEARQAGS